jgi:hypothetical protein
MFSKIHNRKIAFSNENFTNLNSTKFLLINYMLSTSIIVSQNSGFRFAFSKPSNKILYIFLFKRKNLN